MTEQTLISNLMTHRNSIEAMLTAMVGDPSAVEDLAQDLAMVMTRKREGVSEDCNFMAWSRAIAVNLTRDFAKKKARQRVYVLSDEALEVVAEALEPVNETTLDTRWAALQQCVDALPGSQRDILTARYVDNRSLTDLTASLSKKRGAIDTLLYRIRKSLYDCVERRMRCAEV